MHVLVFNLLLVYSQLLLSTLAAVKGVTIFVNNSKPCNITPDCKSRQVYCSLPKALANCSGDSTEIILESPEEHLIENVTISHRSKLWIHGHNNTRTTITCDKQDIGLSFYNIKNVTISDVILNRCGRAGNLSKYQGWFAVSIESTTTVIINNIAVVNSQGVGLAVCNANENVIIRDSSFSNNGQQVSTGGPTMGGGVFLLHQINHPEVHYQIKECNISGNLLPIQGLNSDLREHGAGIYVEISKIAGSANFTFVGIRVFNNSGLHGAGMKIVFTGNVNKITIKIKETHFIANSATGTITEFGDGAGLLVEFLAKNATEAYHMQNLIIDVYDSCFENNIAGVGGGLHVLGSRSDHANKNTVTFHNSTWIGNTAKSGAAVYLSRNYYDLISRGHLPGMFFMDCQFVGNENRELWEDSYVFPTGNMNWLGVGVFFNIYFDVVFSGYLVFSENNGSAIGAIESVFYFNNCNATFTLNRGRDGGAIALLALSVLSFGTGSHILFANNTAELHGGAISVQLYEAGLHSLASSCSFRQNKTFSTPAQWNVTITFANNSAHRGKDLFLTSLKPCQRAFTGQGKSLIEEDKVFSSFTNTFIFDQDTKNQVATISTQYTSKNLTCVIPGKNTQLPVEFRDELNQTVDDAIFHVSTGSNISLSDSSICLSKNTLNVEGKNSSNSGRLHIQTIGISQLTFEMDIKLCDCPPGYNHGKGDTVTCECNVDSYFGLTNCTNDFNVHVKRGVWVGIVNGALATSLCPQWFCSYNNHSLQTYKLPEYQGPTLASYERNLQEFTCAENREGILCGKCTEKKTVFCCSTTYQCKDEYLCNLGWLFFILSSILPITLTFVAITGFGINLTAGYLRGFLLFCQILSGMDIQMGGIVIIPEPLEYINSILKMIYNAFSLRFFHIDALSYCLFPNATALDVLIVQYITTVYAFLMIIIFFLIFDRCALNCSRLLRRVKFSTAKHSVVNGMSALLILCYGNCADVSLRLLNFSKLFGVNQERSEKTYVYLNGEITFFSIDHLRYAIPALFFLSTVILAPLILFLVCPLLHKLLGWLHWEETRVASVLSFCYLGGRMKPFYDIFLSCFKDQFNFFAGLYFLYQLLVLAPQVFGRSGTQNIIVTVAVLVLMLMIHSMAQPYNNRKHNLIDALLFADLILITALSLANRIGFMFTDTLLDINMVSAVQSILISIPIFVLLFAILHHCASVWLVKKRNVAQPKSCNSKDANRTCDERQNLMDQKRSRESSLVNFVAWEQQNEI